MNDTMMKFPTEIDRCTYECCMFMLTCDCGYSKRVKNLHALIITQIMPENNILGVWIDIVVLEWVVTFSFGQKSLNIINSRNANVENYAKESK